MTGLQRLEAAQEGMEGGYEMQVSRGTRKTGGRRSSRTGSK